MMVGYASGNAPYTLQRPVTLSGPTAVGPYRIIAN